MRKIYEIFVFLCVISQYQKVENLWDIASRTNLNLINQQY